MAELQTFRSAFNGFNREDVVHYLEYINSKHTAQVNQLTSEAEYLRTKLESQAIDQGQADTIAALEAERDELRAQVEALQARCAELEEASAVPVCTPAEELEVYRRAERTERMARERADLIYRQTSGILGEASVRVSDVAAQVGPMAEEILAQLSQLQDALSAGANTIRDTAAAMYAIKPADPEA